MSKRTGSITFEQKGIGQILADSRLRVPINQRSYAWEEDHISDLLNDFAGRIGKGEYFLGTILLTRTDEVPEVTDGQQRLATTTVLIAAIRDHLIRSGHSGRADSIEAKYLRETDLRTEDTIPRLQLNIDDDDYFRRRILSRPGSSDCEIQPNKRSHQLIEKAAQLAAEHVALILQPLRDHDHINRLVDWVEFIHKDATVIMVKVPDHINAFTMFETLNDRGLRIAQSDLLKNYLFDRAGDEVRTVHPKWAEMSGALEAVSEEDITVDYIRHYWITRHGPTRERELSDRIKDTISSKQSTVDFVTALADTSHDYSALLNPHHEKWNSYGNSTRRHISTINQHLRVWQIRPLMLAIASKFAIEEARRAFRMCACWSVRFLIAGGRGGLLDRNYSIHAQAVGNGQIKTAAQLYTAMLDILPNDAAFESAFANARVAQNFLARYYLRALELKVKREDEPELVPNDDEEVVNLEHVLPQNPDSSWGIDSEEASAYYRRLGNMAIIKSSVNARLGNRSFGEKKPSYLSSGFVLTQQIAQLDAWSLAEITDRQRRLAKIAVETWPLKA